MTDKIKLKWEINDEAYLEMNKLCMEIISFRDKYTLKECFALVQENMQNLYENSVLSWDDEAKWREMSMDSLCYICLYSTERRKLVGFMSFEETVEADLPCLYLYELQITKDMRRRGCGSWLMKQLIRIAEQRQIPYVFLTVFGKNEQALNFYHQFQFYPHPTSPQSKTFRSGRVVHPDYYILYTNIKNN
ncbi:histone N-acetyltransferase [Schizosaccharomyces cryophilus OY26]|uniref:N-alpha-acetyltransferase 40 n=1 Tax=Schizosaccharomyces cryophilus (strain OY26 / ATCC MYA-4695 / CBS 11777 / NBRC 106824 / NRRL Y48691) TaxID=653667 RepID=S9VP18_SCHCR|nr:histone N-acetyltransferase [Schizosaccharomyces cryophilus OY26]EPY49733.1 histone N-acetyltransferase [Schizosaccharomyces cryophilus OY26]